jgi:2-aminoethylphosphonate-pyruvate transaminase
MTDHDTIENPYLLLTPGPLSTTLSVKEVMLRDWCTWDDDYNQGVVQVIRGKLVQLATRAEGYTSVLMQGSGTFVVEALVGTAIAAGGKLLVLSNGAYGQRIAQIARVLAIDHTVIDSGELDPPDPHNVDKALAADPAITHVAMVHGETATGMLNPLAAVGEVVRRRDCVFIVDAMSTFGGIPLDLDEIGIDFLVSSANKCIQGVPGFGFVLARESALAECAGRARSLALDLYDQWRVMEEGSGKWRYTSPTHTVRAFAQALIELEQEGGVEKRHERYRENHRVLVEGMKRLGFRCFLSESNQSPIITAFHDPEETTYEFKRFYADLKKKGFVIYPGKVTEDETFRIGTIGHVFPSDIRSLIAAIEESIYW